MHVYATEFDGSHITNTYITTDYNSKTTIFQYSFDPLLLFNSKKTVVMPLMTVENDFIRPYAHIENVHETRRKEYAASKYPASRRWGEVRAWI